MRPRTTKPFSYRPHQLHVDGREVSGRLSGVLVDIGDVLGQTQVGIGVWFVLDEPEKVKTGEQSSWQLNVLLNTLLGVVAAIGGVSCSQNGATGIQGSHDAGLGTRNKQVNARVAILGSGETY